MCRMLHISGVDVNAPYAGRLVMLDTTGLKIVNAARHATRSGLTVTSGRAISAQSAGRRKGLLGMVWSL